MERGGQFRIKGDRMNVLLYFLIKTLGANILITPDFTEQYIKKKFYSNGRFRVN